jgi:hypothetical protein
VITNLGFVLAATIRGPAALHQTCHGLNCLHYRHGDRARRVRPSISSLGGGAATHADLSVFAASGATVFTLRASASSTCQPQATSSSRTQSAPLIISRQAFTSSPSSRTSRASPSRSAGTRPSPAASPPGASAHHCAHRYAQSIPTYCTSGLLPDRDSSPDSLSGRRPFFMTFLTISSCPQLSATVGDGIGLVERVPGARCLRRFAAVCARSAP